ncbi:MAG: RimK family alpha-L-glutamate ligase [Eubacterium sp.]|nr:RimK family alpha-L-glutamate ligase [Eubacterium sp.]
MRTDMRGILITNGFFWSTKFDELSDMLVASAAERGVSLKKMENTGLLVDTGLTAIPGFRGRPDFVILWDKDVLLGEFFERQGIPVFNSSKSIAICDDKRKTHLALMSHGLPMPRTIFAPMTYENIGFTDHAFLNRVADRLGFPLVAKEAFGSFGEQVHLVNNKTELYALFGKNAKGKQTGQPVITSNQLLFQEYISSSKGHDVRLQVVGGEVVAAMHRHSETDFRANVSSGASAYAYEPDDDEIWLARQAAYAVGADFCGVDLLFGEEGSLVCEVNSNAHFKNLYQVTGVNTADEIMNHIIRKCNKY